MRPVVEEGYQGILGQSRACGQLWGSLLKDRLHHCYLFEGPRGVGKATTALRLAMAANCEADQGALPCARCRACRLIASGRHPDVMELGPDPEKASDTISVDQVRELLRTLSLHRHSAKCRFVIVDPAHQMNASATNALLKTLEEPPEHSGFILVSDRAGMLLPTVLSRSLRVRFNAVPHVELTAWLEGRGVAEADRVARLAFGSPGLALELAAGRHEALAKASEELLDGIAAGPKALFDYVEALTSSARSGADERVERVLEVLEVLLRDAVQQASGRPDALVEPVASATTARWARAMWPGGIARMERALATARARLHVNVSARVVMEALLAELCLELGEAARGGAS